jgi:CBS-domain-containing membrane protein
MSVIDRKFRPNVQRYLFQCGLATSTVVIVLLFLDVLSHTAIIATLGATVFIVFTMPKYYSSQPRSLIGGYLVGITVGCLCDYLCGSRFAASILHDQELSLTVFGSLAVGVAIFVMVATNTEHPPAAGMSLGLVLNEWDTSTVLFVMGAVLLLSIVKRLLRPFLMDLV